MLSSNLKIVADELEGASGSSSTANLVDAGLWKRIAQASEAGAGTSPPAGVATTVAGYMHRTALALEVKAGTTGAEENAGYDGALKRIVDALEVLGGGVQAGSIENRFRLAGIATVFVTITPSVDLTLYGTDATLTDERAIDGFYLFTNGATTVNRSVAAATSFGGDVLAEFIWSGNILINAAETFFSAAVTSANGSYSQTTAREGMLTDAGSGNTAVYAFKSGANQGLFTRNGNLYLELVGTTFKISTGASYATRTAIYTGTRVDATARFFAMTDLQGATAINKSVRIRVRAHPGG